MLLYLWYIGLPGIFGTETTHTHTYITYTDTRDIHSSKGALRVSGDRALGARPQIATE